MLYQLISMMDKEEVRHLKLFLNRTNAQKQRKDVALFDYVRKNYPDHDEDKLVHKLYGTSEKNALYRLKNRLFEDISKSITLQYYNGTDANQVLYNIGLSRHFLSKQRFEVSNYYLGKAEKKAKDIQSFELLDIIYSDYIRISQETLSINPEQYIEKRQEVRKELYRLREIDDILSVLIYRIKLSSNYSSENKPVVELLQKTIEDFSSNEDIKRSGKLRFRIYHALSRILLQQHDFESLEEYLLLTWKEFNDEKLFSKNNHDTKLQMLTYLTNALFKNKKFEESLAYAVKLKTAMDEYGGLYHDKYLVYYYNGLINNYTLLDKDRAIKILLEAKDDARIRKIVPHAQLIFNLNLALLYFGLKNYKQANKLLVKMKIDDLFRNLDSAFRLKIAIVELIVRYELDDHDFIDYQLSIIRKEFKKLLASGYDRQKTILAIIEKLIFVNVDKKSPKLLQLVATINEMPSDEATDNDILNYNEWVNHVFG